jgi:HAD superfamily hydrolase (TIGR01509 family)
VLLVQPDAVLFDLDGTLIDSEQYHANLIAAFLAEHGVQITDQEKAFVFGHAWQEIYEFLRVGERTGFTLDDLKSGTMEAKRRMPSDGLRVLEGGERLVRRLVQAEVRVAIVSGSSRVEIEHALTLVPIGDALSFYMGCEDYARGKPAPDGYASAARRLSVDPARCLVLEDSSAGIDSAIAAGMRVIATRAANPEPPHPGHQDQARAHHIVDGLPNIDDALIREVMAG